MKKSRYENAIVTYPPPKECSKCGESEWKFSSVSTTGKSVEWECDYCKKKITVKLHDPNEENNKERRESIPKQVRHEVWQRDGGRCVECGSNERLEFDHIIPVSKGGSNTTRNIQLLCEHCNRSKSNKDPGDY
jgi:DNA-directed RNA polymerase subunit RPC12/RpoP